MAYDTVVAQGPSPQNDRMLEISFSGLWWNPYNSMVDLMRCNPPQVLICGTLSPVRMVLSVGRSQRWERNRRALTLEYALEVVGTPDSLTATGIHSCRSVPLEIETRNSGESKTQSSQWRKSKEPKDKFRLTTTQYTKLSYLFHTENLRLGARASQRYVEQVSSPVRSWVP